MENMVDSQYCIAFLSFVSQSYYNGLAHTTMSRSIDAFMFTLLSVLPHNVSLVNDNARGQDKSENKEAVDAIQTGFTTPCQRRWESTATFKASKRGKNTTRIGREKLLLVDVPLVVPRRR
jgi:hypothetical protein